MLAEKEIREAATTLSTSEKAVALTVGDAEEAEEVFNEITQRLYQTNRLEVTLDDEKPLTLKTSTGATLTVEVKDEAEEKAPAQGRGARRKTEPAPAE